MLKNLTKIISTEMNFFANSIFYMKRSWCQYLIDTFTAFLLHFLLLNLTMISCIWGAKKERFTINRHPVFEWNVTLCAKHQCVRSFIEHRTRDLEFAKWQVGTTLIHYASTRVTHSKTKNVACLETIPLKRLFNNTYINITRVAY